MRGVVPLPMCWNLTSKYITFCLLFYFQASRFKNTISKCFAFQSLSRWRNLGSESPMTRCWSQPRDGSYLAPSTSNFYLVEFECANNRSCLLDISNSSRYMIAFWPNFTICLIFSVCGPQQPFAGHTQPSWPDLEVKPPYLLILRSWWQILVIMVIS